MRQRGILRHEGGEWRGTEEDSQEILRSTFLMINYLCRMVNEETKGEEKLNDHRPGIIFRYLHYRLPQLYGPSLFTILSLMPVTKFSMLHLPGNK